MIEKNVIVRLYRNSDLKKDDYSYTWYGKLPCEYLNMVGSRKRRIRVRSWKNFFESLENFQKENYITYYPVIFWSIEEDKTSGMLEISKLNK